MHVEAPTLDGGKQLAKSAFDRVAGLLLLIASSPVLVGIAVAIRLTSPGPAIFRQQRSGRAGVLFTIYKFRTMRADAERTSGAVWATRNDPRVTRLGRILRRTRLDELPQLVNVIMGDMNIVGPRPERPSIFVRLREDLPDYRFRQRTRPGITGWAQINHTYDTSIDDVRAKIRYDLEYLERQSLAEDLMIMAKTLPVMIFRRSGW